MTTKITAPQNETRIEPRRPPPGQIPNDPKHPAPNDAAHEAQ